MQMATRTAQTGMTATKAESSSATPLLLRVLNWIVDADSRYRQDRKLKDMSDERLEDMGMTRRAADMAFYQRGSNHPREQWRHPIRTR